MFWGQLWRKYSQMPEAPGRRFLFMREPQDFFFVRVPNQVDAAWGILDRLTLKHLGDKVQSHLACYLLKRLGRKYFVLQADLCHCPPLKFFFSPNRQKDCQRSCRACPRGANTSCLFPELLSGTAVHTNQVVRTFARSFLGSVLNSMLSSGHPNACGLETLRSPGPLSP